MKTEYVDYSEDTKIQSLLMGRKVTAVDDDKMTLDNGTVIQVIPNEGGCSCSAGDYYLENLNTVDNVITKVELVDDGSSDYHSGQGYLIFVYAENEKIKLMEVVGDDGNGYYGTGYSLRIFLPE